MEALAWTQTQLSYFPGLVLRPARSRSYLHAPRGEGMDGDRADVVPWQLKVTKASMLAEFFFALAMLWWEGLRALKIDISS